MKSSLPDLLSPKNFVSFLNQNFDERYELQGKLLFSGARKWLVSENLLVADFFYSNRIDTLNVLSNVPVCQDANYENLRVHFLDIKKNKVILPQEFSVYYDASNQLHFDSTFGLRQFDFDFEKGWSFNYEGIDSARKCSSESFIL
jgi:hypothetical protein